VYGVWGCVGEGGREGQKAGAPRHILDLLVHNRGSYAVPH
jgi:hypothetical protein